MKLSRAIHFIWDKEAFIGPLIAEGITGLLIIVPLGIYLSPLRYIL